MTAPALPLLPAHSPADPVAWRQARPISRALFLGQVERVAHHLPEQAFAIDLCEDHYLFMVAFAAVLTRGQTNLLPSSRAEGEIRAIAGAYPSSYCLRDSDIQSWLADAAPASGPAVPAIPATQVAAIAFTSGSTGRPRPNPKRWGDLVRGARLAQRRFGFGAEPRATLVVTVPPQHMYGLETSILVPLVTGVGVHSGRPFFPADIQAALAEVPEPRVLITTPAHLRVCTEAELDWPPLAFIISATAPLSRTLAARTEQVLAAPVLEIYGCTEAGSLASRRTLDGELWQLYDGLRLQEGAVVGGHVPQPVLLNDVIEECGEDRFRLLGRQEDLVNIAGKRASLSDLNHKLNEIEGVEDGVFVMPAETTGRISRLAALVVAPELSKRDILSALAQRLDPVFLPRPLYKVERLPRNETGKLPRQALLALLEALSKGGPL